MFLLNLFLSVALLDVLSLGGSQASVLAPFAGLCLVRLRLDFFRGSGP